MNKQIRPFVTDPTARAGEVVTNGRICLNLVREGGLEPPCPHGHTDLNRARLPISPLALTCRRRVVNSATLARCEGSIHVELTSAAHNRHDGERDEDCCDQHNRSDQKMVGGHEHDTRSSSMMPLCITHRQGAPRRP